MKFSFVSPFLNQHQLQVNPGWTNFSSYWNKEKAQKELDPRKALWPKVLLVCVQGNAIILQEEKIKILVFKDGVQLKSSYDYKS